MNAASLHTTWLAVSTQALGWTLLHFVWQGAAIALVLWIFFRLARNAAPQVRYLAGCAGLALMCAAVLGTLIAETQAVKRGLSDSSKLSAGMLPRVAQNSVHAETSAAELHAASGSFARISTNVVATTSSSAATTPARPRKSSVIDVGLLNSLPQAVGRLSQRVEPYLPWIVCCWALGVAVLSLRLLGGWKTVRTLRVAADATDSLWIGRFIRLKARLGIVYPVRLVFSTSAKVPMVIGWLKPVVLVPAGLVTGLTSAQLEAILAHELIHIRRHDYLINLVQNLLETLFFYHPAVAWVSARIRVEREHCCDDAACQVCGGTLDYARALAALAEQRRALNLSVAATGGSLVERVRRLVAGKSAGSREGTSPLPTLALFVAALFAMLAVARIAWARPGAAGTETSAAAATTGEIQLVPSTEHIGDRVILRGRVERPDGQPAVGARVLLRRNYWTTSADPRPIAAASADAGGKFELSYRPSELTDEARSGLKNAIVSAQTVGFGVQWKALWQVDAQQPFVLKLVPDLPIKGRVIDLEGKPVAGVAVRVIRVRAPKGADDLGPWLDTVKSGAMTNAQGKNLGLPLSAFAEESQGTIATDRDGRFTLRGLGAERDVCLALRGETIAYRQIDVATREMQPLKRNLWFYAGTSRPPITDQVLGATFTLEAPPTRPIEGTVRDRATGKPLAGVRVESQHLAGMIVHPVNALQTETDAEGRFRLLGMPQGNGEDMSGRNVIGLVPPIDQPYFVRRIDVPDAPGLATVTMEIDLGRGQWITGRVTNKLTGKPVAAQLVYMPFVANPYAKPPEFKLDGGVNGSEMDRFPTRADGTYRLLGLPGRAIVGVWTPEGSYRKGVGASAIAGMNKNGDFATYRNPLPASMRHFNGLKEVNPAEGSELPACDFALEPSEKIRVSVVDRAGKPVSGCAVLQGGAAGTPLPSGSTFELTIPSPHEPHDVAIYHAGRQIGKYFLLKSENMPSAMTVTLEPCATLVGRLVDDDGAVFAGVEVQAAPAPGTYPYFFIPIVVSRGDGRFECQGLFPGCDYGLVVHGNEVKVQFPLRKIAIEPGKTVNLGDVRLKRRPVE